MSRAALIAAGVTAWLVLVVLLWHVNGCSTATPC